MRSSEPMTASGRKSAESLTRGFRGVCAFLFGMSGFINILALTGAFYMLQIYDRALTSARSSIVRSLASVT